MTPQEVNTFARQQYNAVNDTAFFSDAEIYKLIWMASNEMAVEGYLIEQVYTTTTVASQQEYSYPTNTIAIKRITYNGNKLLPVTMREDDTLTLNNSTTTASGTPQYYFLWNDTIYLRPIPDAAQTLKIFSFNEAQEVDATSTLEIPSVWHQSLTDFVLWKMAAKDKNFQAAAEYEKNWQRTLVKAKKHKRMRLRGDAFHTVKDEDIYPQTYIGAY